MFHWNAPACLLAANHVRLTVRAMPNVFHVKMDMFFSVVLAKHVVPIFLVETVRSAL